MKLYHFPETRGTRPRWMLEELGVPYEVVRVDMEANQHLTPGHLARHPLGRIPVLEDGDLTFFESSAMCMHLADKYPEKGLAPKPGTAERALYYQWFCFAMTEIEPYLTELSTHTWELPEAQRIPDVIPYAKKRFSVAAKALDERLQGKTYALGERFSAVDVVLGCLLSWAFRCELLFPFPTLMAYRERVLARPAAQKLFAAENP